MTLDSTDYDPRPADDYAAGIGDFKTLHEGVLAGNGGILARLASFPSFCPSISHCDQFGIPFAAFPHAI